MRRAPLVLIVLLVALLASWLAMRPLSEEAAPAAPPTQAAVDAESSDGEPGAIAAPRDRVQMTTAASEAPVTVTEPAPPESFVLRILTEDDRPVAGLAIHALGAVHTTNHDGVLDLAPEGEHALIPVSFKAPDERRVELSRGETTVRVPPTIPLSVSYVDAETGARLDRPMLSSGPPVTFNGEVDAPLWPGAAFDVRVEPVAPVTAAGDYVAPRPSELRRRGTLSRYANEAVMTIPVYRAMSVVVRVLEHDGTAAAGADVTVDGESGLTDAAGRATIQGIRFERRGLYRVRATLDGRSEGVTISAPLTPDIVAEVEVVLPPPSAFEDAGSSGGMASSRSRGRTVIRGSSQPRGSSVLVVRVLHRDGAPAIDARVGVDGPWRGRGSTDAAGMVRFAELPAGKYHIAASEIGMIETIEEVELGDGETLRVVLNEPRGRTIRLEVVDAAGRPLPSASVTLGGTRVDRWVRLHEGRQHLDLFTGGAGQLTLSHFPEGTFLLKAAYCGRKAELWIRPGEPARITIPD
jgi:hypothetical protein